MMGYCLIHNLRVNAFFFPLSMSLLSATLNLFHFKISDSLYQTLWLLVVMRIVHKAFKLSLAVKEKEMHEFKRVLTENGSTMSFDMTKSVSTINKLISILDDKHFTGVSSNFLDKDRRILEVAISNKLKREKINLTLFSSTLSNQSRINKPNLSEDNYRVIATFLLPATRNQEEVINNIIKKAAERALRREGLFTLTAANDISIEALRNEQSDCSTNKI